MLGELGHSGQGGGSEEGELKGWESKDILEPVRTITQEDKCDL